MDTLNLLAAYSSIGSFLLGLFGVIAAWPALVNWRRDAMAWSLYVNLRSKAGINIYERLWEFKPGTADFKLAEILVEQGRLFRRELGFYGLTPPPLRDGNPD